jgi:penicillin-binding protein 1C
MLPDENGLYHLWIDGKEIPDIVKKAFIAAEDRRFYDHHGFDLFATLRALRDNFLQGRIVSGASTITQQLIRLLQPRQRTIKDKLLEISRSGRLEEILSKEEILEQYLNRVPMGNNILGVGLAARVYFGKSVANLTLAEVAILAALPKAPGRFNPYRKNRERLLQRKNWVLTRMAEEGAISGKALREAQEDKTLFRRKSFSPMKAPHVVDLLVARGEDVPGIHPTTIDLYLQREVEKILLSHRPYLASRGVKQAAVMVVHNPTLEVLASAGSFSYSSRNQGFNNGTTARRSAGSTLKPFIYAMALEKGYTVSSLLEDTLRKYRTPFGNFSPDNFDTKEYGPVTLRLALGNSLNISALKMMERLDRDLAYEWLERMNLLTDSKRGPDDYGLGLVIGNAEVSLEQLVAAFAMFANGGAYHPLRYLLEKEESAGKPVFSGEVAYIISDILSDPSARMITFGNFRDVSFPFKVSLKTGTSTGYRDGWTVGYTPEYTVGVWIGNFEGTPTNQMSGASGAASIFKDIIYLLHGKGQPSLLRRPENVTSVEVCGISGMRPGPYCRYVARELFLKGTEPTAMCLFHHEDDPYHELPTPYASWVYDKDKKGLAGSYRLMGFSKNLEAVFEEDSVGESLLADLVGIRVKNQDDPETSPRVVAARDEGSTNHYSIGGGMNEEEGPSVDGSVSILYPLPYDRFVIEKSRRGQIIRLEAVSTKPMAYVDWFIDGLHYTRVGPPYHTYWNLEGGRHDITAVTPFKKGDSVQIMVE